VNLSNEDIQDILSLLDSLPYSELTLETSRFTLQLRRSAEGGWTQETQVLPRPELTDPPVRAAPPAGSREPARGGKHPAPKVPGDPATPGELDATPASGASASSSAPLSPGDHPSPTTPPASSVRGADVRDVVSPLPGTFYRAPQPGAPPFVDIGGRVEPGTVVAIIETMKLMNPVYPGAAGTVTEICLDDGQFAEQGTVLMRVSAGAG
jgi:acetyl-CoA carboxylase biotin carboxyl carrier protein